MPAHVTPFYRWLLLCGVVLSLFTWSDDASAYAWMIGNGYAKCSTCHTDPSGGETLTHMGRVQSQRLLSSRWGKANTLSEAAESGYGLTESSWLRVGGSARLFALLKMPKDTANAHWSAFPMQSDVYGTAQVSHFRAGASLGYADVPETSPHARAAEVVRADSGPALISRWHWLGIEFDHTLLRAGRINLPFGVRIPEHVMWVRDATKTDRESDQQHGIALAGWGGRLRWELMAVAGNFQVRPDAVRERGYSGYIEWLAGTRLAIGASSMLLRSEQSILTGRTQPTLRQAHGPMLRWSPFQHLGVMLETDVTKISGRELGYVGLLQIDYEPVQGLHLRTNGEVLDGGRHAGLGAIPSAGKPVTGAWLTMQWFFLPHWDLQVDLVTRYDQAATWQGQLHFYL